MRVARADLEPPAQRFAVIGPGGVALGAQRARIAALHEQLDLQREIRLAGIIAQHGQPLGKIVIGLVQSMPCHGDVTGEAQVAQHFVTYGLAPTHAEGIRQRRLAIKLDVVMR